MNLSWSEVVTELPLPSRLAPFCPEPGGGLPFAGISDRKRRWGTAGARQEFIPLNGIAFFGPALNALPLSRESDSARFAITRFASGLGFPSSMTSLADGSLLAAVTDGDPAAGNSPFGRSDSQLVRLPDADHNGVADGKEVLVTLPGFVTSVRRVGDLIFALSSGRQQGGQDPTVSMYRTGRFQGDHATDPLQLAGRLRLSFPDATSWEHTSYALAARFSPSEPGLIELYFNVGSRSDASSTDPALRVKIAAESGARMEDASMEADSIQRLLLRDNGTTIEVAPPRTIATGLRNAAGLSFDAAGNLFLEDNGFDTDPAQPSGARDGSFSADELNRIAAAELGTTIPDFGFAESYVRYSTGMEVNPDPAYRSPLVSFLPQSGRKSEGATEITTAPEGFPGEFANTIFTNFFGKFGVGTARNDENPVVATDVATGSRFHFINNQVLGNPAGLLAAPNKLFLSDYSSAGVFFGAANGLPADELGVIYQISPVQVSKITTAPTVNHLDSTSCGVTWSTNGDVISTLKIWGGSILEQAPRVVRVRPITTGTPGFQASVQINDLTPQTTYNYSVQLGDQNLAGSFNTLSAKPAISWLRQYGSAADDSGMVVAEDASHIYVGGMASGHWDGTSAPGGTDGFVSRFDLAGNEVNHQWFASNRNDQIRCIVPLKDSLYFAGGTEGQWVDEFPAGTGDGFFIKTSAGRQDFLKILGGEPGQNGYELIRSMTTDSEGNLFIIGYSSSARLSGITSPSPSVQSDAFISKVNSKDGSIAWLNRLDFGRWDYGMSLKMHPSGDHLFATGYLQAADNTHDAFLAKFDRTTGRQIWIRTIGSAGKDDYGQDLAVTRDNEIVVTISTDGNLDGQASRGERDVALVKFDSDGNRLWTTQFGSNGSEEARAIVNAEEEGFYVCGKTKGNLGGEVNHGGEDAFVSRMDDSGRVLWTQLIGTPSDDSAWSLVAEEAGGVLVTGETGGSLDGHQSRGGKDVFLARIGGFRHPSAPLDLQPGRTCTLPGLRDYDGILHGGAAEAIKDSIAADYRFQGFFSLRRDGLQQALFTNRRSGRWASAAVDPVTRQIDYADHGKGGITRVVGIYDDPLVKEGEQNTARPGFLLSGEKAPERFGPFDSQRRFQNDLLIDNLSARLAGDFDGDGIQELYWKVNDGTAYLRSLLHDDGNIRYANYQSRDQMTSYLSSYGHADRIATLL